jgi:hypothetical protein
MPAWPRDPEQATVVAVAKKLTKTGPAAAVVVVVVPVLVMIPVGEARRGMVVAATGSGGKGLSVQNLPQTLVVMVVCMVALLVVCMVVLLAESMVVVVAALPVVVPFRAV